MNPQEITRLINSGQNITVTPELIAAIRERGHPERSEAIHAAIRWVVQKSQSAFHRLTRTTESASVRSIINVCDCTHR